MFIVLVLMQQNRYSFLINLIRDKEMNVPWSAVCSYGKHLLTEVGRFFTPPRLQPVDPASQWQVSLDQLEQVL